MSTDKNVSLRLSGIDRTISSHYYHDHVKCLVLDNLNSSLYQEIIKHVNCSQIKELAIAQSPVRADALKPLLARFTSMNIRDISFDIFIIYIDLFIGKVNGVKQLDISNSEHAVDKENII